MNAKYGVLIAVGLGITLGLSCREEDRQGQSSSSDATSQPSTTSDNNEDTAEDRSKARAEDTVAYDRFRSASGMLAYDVMGKTVETSIPSMSFIEDSIVRVGKHWYLLASYQRTPAGSGMSLYEVLWISCSDAAVIGTTVSRYTSFYHRDAAGSDDPEGLDEVSIWYSVDSPKQGRMHVTGELDVQLNDHSLGKVSFVMKMPDSGEVTEMKRFFAALAVVQRSMCADVAEAWLDAEKGGRLEE
jgi:hypothetical protein